MRTETLFIDFNSERPEKANAAFLAWLAYPKDEAKVTALRRAFLSAYYREKAHNDPGWTWRPQSIEPGYLLWETDDVYRVFNKGLSNLEKRLRAAEMGALILTDEVGGEFINMRIGGEIPNVNVTARYVARVKHGVSEGSEPTDGAISNIKHREWASTRPVIHMALAYRSIRLELEHSENSMDILESLGGNWIERAVSSAMFFRYLIIKSDRFQKKDFASFKIELRQLQMSPD